MSKHGESAATILDVARRAGVSRTTVSRVLNEPDRVLPATLKRVTDAVESLRYSPNSVARSLRSGRTGLIALLVGDIAQPFHGALAQSVAAAAETRGLGVVLYDLAHSTSRLEDVLKKLPHQGVDGLIIATADDVSIPAIRATIDQCVDSGMPVVTGVEQFKAENVTAVGVDHSHCTRIAMGALREAGFTSTALLLGDAGSPIARRLIMGADGARIIDAAYTFDAAAEAARILPEDVDSLIIGTTPMALGAMSGLATRSLPIIVCEEVPLARQVRPSLTTSAVPPEEIGEEMIRLIVSTLDRRPIERRTLIPQLSRRESF